MYRYFSVSILVLGEAYELVSSFQIMVITSLFLFFFFIRPYFFLFSSTSGAPISCIVSLQPNLQVPSFSYFLYFLCLFCLLKSSLYLLFCIHASVMAIHKNYKNLQELIFPDLFFRVAYCFIFKCTS